MTMVTSRGANKFGSTDDDVMSDCHSVARWVDDVAQTWRQVEPLEKLYRNQMSSSAA